MQAPYPPPPPPTQYAQQQQQYTQQYTQGLQQTIIHQVVYNPQQFPPPNAQYVYAQPSLISVPSNQPLLMNQISLPTDPNSIQLLTVTNNLIDLNEKKRREEQEKEQKFLEVLLIRCQAIHTSYQTSKIYLFFMGLKVFLQFMFLLFIIISLIFYLLRPKYQVVQVDNKKYFKATSPPVSESKYECTPIQDTDVLKIINYADTWVFICTALIIAYKLFYIYMSIKYFQKIFRQKYIITTEKFDVSYLDYINLFFDYAFIISLSPLTAVVYEDCANLRYGIYLFGAVSVYVAGVVFSLFNFIGLISMIEVCKAKSFDKLMAYPFLIIITLPAIAILICVACGLNILNQKVNNYTETRIYYDGSKTVEHKDDDVRWLVLFPIVCVIVVVVFFCVMILISFALLLVYCHPAMIIYYILTILLSIGFLIKNRHGADYRLQLFSLLIIDYIRQTNPQMLKTFYNYEFNDQSFCNNPSYKQLQQQSRIFYNSHDLVFYKYNIRQTCKLYNQYKAFYADLIELFSQNPIDKKEEPEKELAKIEQPESEDSNKEVCGNEVAQAQVFNLNIADIENGQTKNVQPEAIQPINSENQNEEADKSLNQSEQESQKSESEVPENEHEPKNRRIRRERY
ncbi:hypothetical protein ABPG72_009134 [Tetrahymena utriculariae]